MKADNVRRKYVKADNVRRKYVKADNVRWRYVKTVFKAITSTTRPKVFGIIVIVLNEFGQKLPH